MMKQGFIFYRLKQVENGKNIKTLSEKDVKVLEWAFDRIKEAIEKVARDEARKLRRIIAPAGGQRGVTMSYLCPNCNSFPLDDYIWWVSGEKAYKLVVRDLLRKIRLEATRQAFGGTNR